MCLLKVKDEQEYSVPARVRRTTKWTGTSSSSPPRTSYYSNTRVVEDRRVSSAPLPPHPPPPSPHSYFKESRTEYKRSEFPIPPSNAVIESKQPSGTSTAPSATGRTRTHYIEVEHDDNPSSSGSSSASNDDIRSRTTHQTSKTSKTSKTRQSSKSETTAPTSQYSVHEREREVRREKTYSRPRDEYETYQYINAPISGTRSRDYYDPRASSGSYGRRSQQYYR